VSGELITAENLKKLDPAAGLPKTYYTVYCKCGWSRDFDFEITKDKLDECPKCGKKLKLKKNVIGVHNPILIADGDWALARESEKIILYSRFPRDGGQLVFEYNGKKIKNFLIQVRFWLQRTAPHYILMMDEIRRAVNG